MDVRGRVADAARFMVRPTFANAPTAGVRGAGQVLLATAMVHLALMAAVVGPLWAAGQNAGVLPAPAIPPGSLAASPLAFLVIAPLLEELLFRGWLTGRAAALRFGAAGFAALALLLAGEVLIPDHARIFGFAGAMVAIAGLVHWSVTRSRDAAVPPLFIRHFPVIVWASAALFGLIHLGNFEAISGPLGVGVVLPQVLGGLLLAYVRTRAGLIAAIAYHSAYNALTLVLGAAAG